jgi:hypothetical protein
LSLRISCFIIVPENVRSSISFFPFLLACTHAICKKHHAWYSLGGWAALPRLFMLGNHHDCLLLSSFFFLHQLKPLWYKITSTGAIRWLTLLKIIVVTMSWDGIGKASSWFCYHVNILSWLIRQLFLLHFYYLIKFGSRLFKILLG